MPSLKKWLRKMSLSRSKATTSIKDDVTFGKGDVLPFLPSERPSILTPSPSREDLISPMVSYGFFQNLPYEIRRNILIEAFGGRTLHMDLSYNHPEPDFNYESNQARGTELHKGWQWFSCVCHRPVEWPEDSPCRNSPFPILAKWGFEKAKAKPSEDNCLRGDFNRDEYGPMRKEDQLSECFIGVMGWLLTCRQAYADGIDVLFTTNTFYITGHELLKHLPNFLLPQRLRGVQSLEMRCFTKFRQTNLDDIKFTFPLRDILDDPTKKDSELHTLCRMVVDSFPNVRQLYIMLDCYISPPESPEQPIIESVILSPLEDMLRIFGPGRELNVSVHMDLWDHLVRRYAHLYGPELRIETDGFMEGRFWKVFGPEGEFGYWICSGQYYRLVLGSNMH